jgi:ABC-2 type transport system permease protein
LRPSTPRAIIAILGTELRRRLADRSIIVSSFVAPAVIAAIIGFAFGNAGATHEIKIGIALTQPSAEARAVVQAGVNAAGFSPNVEVVTISNPGALRRQVSSGALGGGVIIPKGFAEAASFGIPTRPGHSDAGQFESSALPGLLADVTIGPGNGPKSARLTVVSPSATSIDGQLSEALAASISSRIYAGALEVSATSVQTPATESGLAALVASAQRAATRSISLDLGALSVGTNHAVIGYYGSSIAVVFLFIGAGLGTRAIAMERTAGTLTRLAAAPVSSTAVVVAKMLAVLFTALVGLMVLWAETVFAFGASWGEPGGVLLMCAAATLSMCALAMFLTSLAKDESQAFAASIIVGILLGILGGNFFPPGSLPGVLQVVSLATPNGWALVGFGRLALVHAGVSGIVGPLVILGVISAIFVAGASFRIKRVVEL